MGGTVATEHISPNGVVEAPGPGGIGDHPHNCWVLDFEPEEVGERTSSTRPWRRMSSCSGASPTRRWPRSGPGSTAVRGQLNAMPKYVLSTTLERADWTARPILRSDVVTEVTRLA